MKNLSINRRSENKLWEKKKSIESEKKNRKKNKIALETQEKEEEKPVHSTEYDGRWRDHQPTFRRGWTDQLQIFIIILFLFYFIILFKFFVLEF